jgi:hypothetical protein
MIVLCAQQPGRALLANSPPLPRTGNAVGTGSRMLAEGGSSAAVQPGAGRLLVGVNEPSPRRGSHPRMTRNFDPRRHPDRDGDVVSLGWDGDAAVDLLIANTGPGQTVLDFDDDPVLRAAAQATGRRYRAHVPLTHGGRTPHRPAERAADLVTLFWPHPHTPTFAAARDTLATAAGCLVPGGHVALVLEPNDPQPYTITWTGALLTAAHDVGLNYLQDIICLHPASTSEAPDPRTGDGSHRGAHDPDGGHDPDGAPFPGRQHRVVLILRNEAGRHA